MTLNLNENATVNIIGYNCKEWMIGYHGTILSGYISVGVYTTNL